MPRTHSLLGLAPLLVLLAACGKPSGDPPAEPTKALGNKGISADGSKPFAAVKAIDRLVSGSTVAGSLTLSDRRFTDGTFFDVWPYSGNAGDEVTFTLASDDFDTYLIVRELGDPSVDGAQIGADDDSAGELNSRLTVTLPATGNYAVIANSVAAGAEGVYVLSASGGSVAPGQQIGGSSMLPIAAGEVVTGSLTAGDLGLGETYADLYTIDATPGSLITSAVRSGDFDAVLYIGRVENGTIETQAQDDDSGGGTDARAEFRVSEGGTYVIAASSFAAGATGSYLLAVAVTPPIDYATRYPESGDPDERYALLVGIDDYPGTGSDLPSSVDDVEVFRATLVNQLGFRSENIRVITDQEAFRDHIIAAFQRHLGQAGPGGSAVFYYSGHGTQLDENLGTDDEPDGKDEAIYIWGNDFQGSVIVDEEIGALADRLPTDRVLVVLDACHSGTGTRGAGGDFPIKEVNFADVRETTQLPLTVVSSKGVGAAAGDPGGDIPGGPREHLLLSAAANTEFALGSSQEWPDIGRRASVFTYYLAGAIARMGTGATWEEIMDDVRPKTSNYSAARDNSQTVQIEGVAGTRTLAEFFGL